jgi:transcription antitermination factor NusG
VVGLLPLRLDGQGTRPRPTALGSREAVELLLRQELARKDPPNAAVGRIVTVKANGVIRTAKLGLEKDEQVVITVGPFKGTVGQVSKVLNRSEVALKVTLMGNLVNKVVAECDLQRS